MNEFEDDPDFIADLDKQAKSLLRRLEEEAKLDGEARLSVQDHVRGFAAVTSYVETRLKIAPPKTAKSRISELTERLNDPPKRQRKPNGGASGGRGASEDTPQEDSGPPPP